MASLNPNTTVMFDFSSASWTIWTITFEKPLRTGWTSMQMSTRKEGHTRFFRQAYHAIHNSLFYNHKEFDFISYRPEKNSVFLALIITVLLTSKTNVNVRNAAVVTIFTWNFGISSSCFNILQRIELINFFYCVIRSFGEIFFFCIPYWRYVFEALFATERAISVSLQLS